MTFEKIGEHLENCRLCEYSKDVVMETQTCNQKYDKVALP